MKKIVFIANTISQPRVIKRIESLYNAGFNVKVYGFDRGVYSCNTLPDFYDFELLGEMKNGRDYLKKIRQYKKCIEYIVKNNRVGTIYYSFSIITSYFLMCMRVRYIYELSDLAYGYPRFNFIRPISKFIDRKIVRNSLLTIMTSAGFKEYLFKSTDCKNIILQPNKLNSFFLNKIRPKAQNIDIDHIKFGFVGAIRYKQTILRFAKIIGEFYPQHEFHFYGDSTKVKEFQKETHSYHNIYFHGAFRNPVDLPHIYSNIDIVVACYETGSLNERIAEPNKLYESIYFQKPIIVSKRSFLAHQVKRLGCGYVINSYDDKEIRNYIENITYSSVNRIQHIEANVALESLVDSPDSIIKYLKRVDD